MQSGSPGFATAAVLLAPELGARGGMRARPRSTPTRVGGRGRARGRMLAVPGPDRHVHAAEVARFAAADGMVRGLRRTRPLRCEMRGFTVPAAVAPPPERNLFFVL